ncbi:MAG: hypothetical protein ACYCUI_05650 [Vulcanimicrobiaceae bacterium]
MKGKAYTMALPFYRPEGLQPEPSRRPTLPFERRDSTIFPGWGPKF